MWVLVENDCDAVWETEALTADKKKIEVPHKKAMFAGQTYDLPSDARIVRSDDVLPIYSEVSSGPQVGGVADDAVTLALMERAREAGNTLEEEIRSILRDAADLDDDDDDDD